MTDLNKAMEESGSGGSPAFSWKDAVPNQTFIKGTIVDTDYRQATEFGSTEPRWWKPGEPVMNGIITLQTELRDPTIPDDDGRRRIFAVKPSAMWQAWNDASVAAGRQFEVGGTLAVMFTGEKPSAKGNPAKQYRAEYAPPAPLASMIGTSAPAPATRSLV